MVKKIHRKSDDGGGKGKEGVEFDFGLGKLSFGGIFDGIGKLVDLTERAEKAGGELIRQGTIKGFGGRKGMHGVYGFTIKTGIGGKKGLRIETFGNIKKTKKGPKVEESREPIVDVFDEKDHVSIIAELPGVAEGDIKMSFSAKGGSASGGKGDILILEAVSTARKYSKEIMLPASVDEKSKEVKFHNGILEIKCKKTSKQNENKS